VSATILCNPPHLPFVFSSIDAVEVCNILLDWAEFRRAGEEILQLVQNRAHSRVRIPSGLNEVQGW